MVTANVKWSIGKGTSLKGALIGTSCQCVMKRSSNSWYHDPQTGNDDFVRFWLMTPTSKSGAGSWSLLLSGWHFVCKNRVKTIMVKTVKVMSIVYTGSLVESAPGTFQEMLSLVTTVILVEPAWRQLRPTVCSASELRCHLQKINWPLKPETWKGTLLGAKGPLRTGTDGPPYQLDNYLKLSGSRVE